MGSGFRATLRRSHAALAAVFLLLSVASCSEEAAQDYQASRKRVKLANQSTVAQNPKGKKVGAAGERPVGKMNQSDDLFNEMADRACRNNDFYSFFHAFSGSPAVRDRHTGGDLTVGPEGRSRRMIRRQYLAENIFPVSPMDKEYVTAASADNFAQDSRVRVEWTLGTFDRHLDSLPPVLQKGLGRMIRQTGEGGFLLFAPTGTCWELFADIAQPTGKHLDK